jgi:hypothetical protein
MARVRSTGAGAVQRIIDLRSTDRIAPRLQSSQADQGSLKGEVAC